MDISKTTGLIHYAFSLLPESYDTRDHYKEDNRYFDFTGFYGDLYANLTYNHSKAGLDYMIQNEGSYVLNEDFVATIGYKKDLTDWVSIDFKGSYFFRTKRWARRRTCNSEGYYP